MRSRAELPLYSENAPPLSQEEAPVPFRDPFVNLSVVRRNVDVAVRDLFNGDGWDEDVQHAAWRALLAAMYGAREAERVLRRIERECVR